MRDRKASDRKYRSSEKGRITHRAAQKRWSRRHPEQARLKITLLEAHSEAVASGKTQSFTETRALLAREKFLAAEQADDAGDPAEADRLRLEALAIRKPPPRPDHGEALVGLPLDDPASPLDPPLVARMK
jgi:hypothetical protein